MHSTPNACAEEYAPPCLAEQQPTHCCWLFVFMQRTCGQQQQQAQQEQQLRHQTQASNMAASCAALWPPVSCR
jgi:hypothetical protein